MLVFNRPDTTARVLQAIRAARPARLLVVADGPRPSRPEDARRCAEVRALFDAIDWPCEVEREFAAENLGCRRRVASGLDWVFARVPEAIVLEDDCLPDPSFFPFCEELLARYRDEPRVAAVTGNNFQGGRVRGDASYYFSRWPHIWGWASWRRAWRHYDVAVGDWPARARTRWLAEQLGDPRAARHWARVFDAAHAGAVDTWDYQWTYAVWAQRGLVATPNVNLVTNIGFGAGATHTTGPATLAIPSRPIPFPLVHPASVAADDAADRHVQRELFTPTLRARVGAIVYRLLGRSP